MLIGGYDEHDGAALYFMDYLGTMDKVSFSSAKGKNIRETTCFRTRFPMLLMAMPPT